MPLSRLETTVQIFCYHSGGMPGIGQNLPGYLHLVIMAAVTDDDEGEYHVTGNL